MQDSTQRLLALSAYAILDTPPEPEFDDIVQIAQRVCKTPVALVSLVAEDRQWFKARIGFDPCETPIGQSVCAYALQGNDLLVIPDLTADPRTSSNTLVTEPPHIRFYAGAPLTTPEGVGIGSLCVIDDKPRPEGLTRDQAETLRGLARQTMVVMALRRAMKQRESALSEATQAGLMTLDRALASEAARDRSQDAEALMREAQEAARIGAFEVDIVANRFTVSHEFCRIFGIDYRDSFDASEFEMQILLQDRSVASSSLTRAEATASPDVEYRIRRVKDGAVRWIARRSSFIWDETGKPIRMLGVIQDVTERKQVEARTRALVTLGDQLRTVATTQQAVSIAARLLGETLAVARAGYAVIDDATDYFTVETDWTATGIQSFAGRHSLSTLAATKARLMDGAPLTVANIPAAGWLARDAKTYAALGTRSIVNIPLVLDDRLIGVLFVHNSEPRTWSSGEIEFAVTIADRTYAALAKLQAEAHQRVLNEELSHRLKNTLSMVQAIIAQTLRGVAERGTVQALEERIIALSKAHDVLLQETWSGAPIATVIGKVIGLQGRENALKVHGQNLALGPKATLSLSLLLHELATNSMKYGSFSVETGYVELAWSIDDGATEPELVLDWTETGGPPAEPPKRRGFGSRLIAMGLAGAGKAKLDYTTEGLRAAFRAPLRACKN